MGNVIGISLEIPLHKVISCCWRQACAPKKNLKALQKDCEWLKAARNDVKRKIEDEENQQQMKRLDQVEQWLSRVEAVEAEVDKLMIDASQQSANKCFCGFCPQNCKAIYIFRNRVADIQEEVATLLELKPDVLAEMVHSAPRKERPMEPTSGMHLMLDEVWSYIEDEQVGMIGVYGMGGVGKTTLLTAINNKVCNSSTQTVDIVIWIVVSKTLSITKVQDDIGKKIGFQDDKWKNKSQEDKAMDIFSVLNQKKYVLLLDDMWERLDLINLGVPLPNPNNKSKIVFTTRSRDVCGRMEACTKIKVNCLAEEDAWDLFQKKVGKDTLDAHSELPNLAKDVAKKCDGLPLALITIGRAMACKTNPQEWRHAIELLKRYTSEFSGMGDEIFPLLKFSYDSLPNAAVRSCFLYCSLYPEDDIISIKKLIDYWICEGFLDKFDDLDKARNQGYDCISTLVHASLLEDCSPGNIKMHDVIRDMAIWIGCECGAMKDKFFVQAGVGLRKTNGAGWEGAERISLTHNYYLEVTGTPKCPNLITLLLNDTMCTIPRGFFRSMANLRVLDLSGNKNIMELSTEICELVSLQYLDLSSTGLKELSIEFRKLINLKYLNLESTRMQKIAAGVLSSFKKLQVFKFEGCGGVGPYGFDSHWDGLPKTLVKELESLEYLSDLTITIESDFALLNFLSSGKLMSLTTKLTLTEFRDSAYIDLLFLKEMKLLERLDIRRCRSLVDLRIGEGNETSKIINHNGFHSVRTLFISYCPLLKDITCLAFAPNLEEVDISNCYAMKELVGAWKQDGDEDADHQEGGRPVPFARLTVLRLQNLTRLDAIYPTVLPFRRLIYLWLEACPKLKKLPFRSSNCKRGRSSIMIRGYDDWWKGLEWDDEATRIAFLPFFKPISRS